jgi:glycolate oxidase FAD binding subunit
MNNATADIDSFGPLPLIRPASVTELGEWIRDSAAVYPFGGRTKLAFGATPTKSGIAVDLTGMAEIIDYPARDMTVTVQTGITIKRLTDILARENLRLPIDVAQGDRATLGGILATNTSGPRRHAFGTLRDYVIGISALNDNGNEFKAGGRVVKNVPHLSSGRVGSTRGVADSASQHANPARLRRSAESSCGEGCFRKRADSACRCCVDAGSRL